MEYVLIYLLIGLPYVVYSMLVSWDGYSEDVWYAVVISFVVQLLTWPLHIAYAIQYYVHAKRERSRDR